jgi:hypothetical protein
MTMHVRIRALLEHFIWELSDHPRYNPDLAPIDYHLFTQLQNCLGSQRFNNNEEEELMEGVKTWLNSQAVDFFDTGMQKLILRNVVCISRHLNAFQLRTL